MNSVESPISPRRESIFGRGYVSLHTLSFSFVRSTHIQTFPFGLGTVTIPAHHSVGCSIFLITPSFSILASSAFTLVFVGKGMHLGVVMANVLAFGFNWISYSPSSSPSPWKSCWYFTLICSSKHWPWILFILAIKFNFSMAGRPRRGSFKPLTT